MALLPDTEEDAGAHNAGVLKRRISANGVPKTHNRNALVELRRLISVVAWSDSTAVDRMPLCLGGD